jgi:hypothetical protein
LTLVFSEFQGWLLESFIFYLHTYLGSMLWSQFSAIFTNFWQKIGVFHKNQCYDQNFA